MDKNKVQPVMLTIKDIAFMLQCSTMHVRRMIKDGLFPPPKMVGKAHRWHPDTVDEWMRGGVD